MPGAETLHYLDAEKSDVVVRHSKPNSPTARSAPQSCDCILLNRQKTARISA